MPQQNVPEVSIPDLIRLIIRYKWVLLLGVIIGVFAGYAYFASAPKVYMAKANFFLPPEASEGPSMGFPYSSVLGISSSSLENKIVTFGKSKRLKNMILADFVGKAHPTDEEMDTLSWEKGLKVIRQGEGFFSVSFTSQNPQWSYTLVTLFMHNLVLLLDELEMTSNQNPIKMLDAPVLPTEPDNNSFVNFVMFGALGGFVTVLFLVFCYDYLKAIFNGKE